MKTLSGEGGRNPFPRRPRRRVEQHGLSPWLQATPGGGQLLGSQPFSLRKSKEECVHFNARTAPARGSTTALRLIALSFQHASALYTTPMAQIQSPCCTHSPARSPGPPAPAAAHTVETVKHHYVKSSAITSEPRRRQRGYVPIGVATLDIKKTSWRERETAGQRAREDRWWGGGGKGGGKRASEQANKADSH